MNRRTLLAHAPIAAAFILSSRVLAETKSHVVELLSGGKRDGKWLAGLSIKLAPEWKTYWRMPGQSGIPPQFDWSASQNVKSVAVGYPVPGRFADGSGEIIGYHDEVVFPLVVDPLRADQPVMLRIVALFGVCRDICIPARHELSLDLLTAAPDTRVAVWQQRVPVAGVAVEDAKLDGEGGTITLVLALAGEPQDIFVEQESGAYFGRPEPGPDSYMWRLPVSNINSAAEVTGKPLLVTVSYAGKAVEQTVRLD